LCCQRWQVSAENGLNRGLIWFKPVWQKHISAGRNPTLRVSVAFLLHLLMQEGQVIECSQVSDVRVGAPPKV